MKRNHLKTKKDELKKCLCEKKNQAKNSLNAFVNFIQFHGDQKEYGIFHYSWISYSLSFLSSL